MIKFKLRLKIAILSLAFFVLSGNLAMAQGAEVYPNDPYLKQQNYLQQINALAAWSAIKESPEITVAVIDSGVDINHPDLVDNIWHNPDEIPGDGLDNDHNGYVDDTVGWDFILNSPDPKPKFIGGYSKLGIDHGTIVAGVIGATGNNNFGLAGLSWKIKIMPLRVMDGKGIGQTDAVYRAIKYAIDKKADIINLSMVGSEFDPKLDQVIAEAYRQGIIIVAAAGNETNTEDLQDDFSLNLALHPQYPICHDGGEGHNYVLGVGAVDGLDQKSRFSNYGSKCLDLVAPGESFFGTLFYDPAKPDFNKYFGGYWSGTSLAAPQVSAAAALVKALRQSLTNGEIYDLLIKNSDNIDASNPTFQGLLGGGRLNLAKVMAAAAATPKQGLSLILSPAGKFVPQVLTVNESGQEQGNFLAYDKNFLGGVDLASADLNNDGQKEIITGAGTGGGPQVRIFKSDGQVIGQFFAYDKKFNGGINIAAGDLDGDGVVEIITAPLGKLASQIKIFDSAGKLKSQFLAYDKNFLGGVNLALSDINADGIKEIVTAPGPGSAPLVKVFNGSGKLLENFLAYDNNFKGGVKVASADLYGDQRTEIITVPAGNFKPQVRLFSPAGDIDLQWLAAAADYSGGLNLTAAGLENNSPAQIIISQNAGGTSEIKFFTILGQLTQSFPVWAGVYGGNIDLTVK
ncbi:MAG: S8 family serine peptidase [Candidatus Komeilibacteria bacterium]|nr:S8 family serine peptidase [Candidatus Komeilibacteria bacterium]